LWLGLTWHLVPHIAYQQFTCPVTGISYQYQDYSNKHIIFIEQGYKSINVTINHIIALVIHTTGIHEQ